MKVTMTWCACALQLEWRAAGGRRVVLRKKFREVTARPGAQVKSRILGDEPWLDTLFLGEISPRAKEWVLSRIPHGVLKQDAERARLSAIRSREFSSATRADADQTREKGTDEVAETSESPDSESPMHGGDGNSQECDAPSETASPDAEGQSGQAPGDDGEADGLGEDQGQGDGQGAGGNTGTGQKGKSGEHETAEPGTNPGKAGTETSSRTDEPKGESDPGGHNPYAVKGAGNGEDGGSVGPKPSEWYRAPRDEVPYWETTPVPRGTARDLRKSLTRLFRGMSSSAPSELDGWSETGCRIDGRKLVTELVTKRFGMGRILREDTASLPKRIIVACDNSGSCSASSPATIKVLVELSATMPMVLGIVHANGQISGVIENGVWTPCKTDPTWTGLVAAKKIVGVLLFGDADGFCHFSQIWRTSKCPAVWLDSYSAKSGVKHRPAGFTTVYPTIGSVPADKQVVFVQGVNNAETACIALRAAARRLE